MEIIKNLIQTLMIIIVLAVFLEMLLPRGKMMPYVKMVMGLLVIIAVLQAISGLLQRDWLQELPSVAAGHSPAAAGGASGVMGMEDIMAAGKELQLNNQNLAVEQYRQGLSSQVLAVAQMNAAVNVVDALVKLSPDPGEQSYACITEIVLVIDPFASPDHAHQRDALVTPVNVKINDALPVAANSNTPSGEISRQAQEEAQKVARVVAGFYSLPPEQVVVEYKKT